MLEGLSINEDIALPDAIETIAVQAAEREKLHPDRYKNEFTSLLDELVIEGKKSGEIDDEDEDNENDGEDSENDVKANLQDEAAIDVIQIDRKMREGGEMALKRQIQMKLQRKVLPVLQRHLFDSGKKTGLAESKNRQKQPIRSFVAVAIAKIIRKLPIQFFRSQLQKLIN